MATRAGAPEASSPGPRSLLTEATRQADLTYGHGFRPDDERRVGRMRCCAARYPGRSEARHEHRFPDGALRGRSEKPTED